MASPTASGSSKANAASPAAELTSRPSKRRRVSTPQIKDEEHTKPSLTDAVFSSAENGIKAVFSSAEDGIKAVIESAYGKVHADAVSNLKRDMQQKDAELKQKDTELQQKDAELQVCKAKLADIAAALSKAPAAIDDAKSGSGVTAATDDTAAADETAAADDTPAADKTPTADETSEKTLLPLRACEIRIHGGTQRLYAVHTLEDMLEKLGAKRFNRQVMFSGPGSYYKLIPNVHVITSREAYSQGCQEVTIPGRYHGIRVRTVWWEWVKQCLARWERMEKNEYCFEEPDEAKRVTEEVSIQDNRTPLSIHFHTISQNRYEN